MSSRFAPAWCRDNPTQRNRFRLAIWVLNPLSGCNQSTPGGLGARDVQHQPAPFGPTANTFTLGIPVMSPTQQAGSGPTPVGIRRATKFDLSVTRQLTDPPEGLTLEPTKLMGKRGSIEATLVRTWSLGTSHLFLRRTHHALDSLRRALGALGAGTGDGSHAERIHSHPARCGGRRGTDPHYPGAKTDLTSDLTVLDGGLARRRRSPGGEPRGWHHSSPDHRKEVSSLATCVAAPDLTQDCAQLHARQTISWQGQPAMSQCAIPPDTGSLTRLRRHR